MKKIFGLLSLIAILTVSFTAQASTIDTHDEVVSYDLADEVAGFDLAIVPTIGADVTPLVSIGSELGFSDLFHVAVCPVSNTDFGEVASVNIVTGLGNSPLIGTDEINYLGLPDVIPLQSEYTVHTSHDNVETNTFTKDWFGTHNGKLNSTKRIS